MQKLILALAVAAAPVLAMAQSTAAPAPAAGSPAASSPAASTAAAASCAPALGPDTMLGKTRDEVETALKGMGYEIRSGGAKGSKVEVYFVKGTGMGEVYVDSDTGMITELTWKTE